jgi:hypothetical protein
VRRRKRMVEAFEKLFKSTERNFAGGGGFIHSKSSRGQIEKSIAHTQNNFGAPSLHFRLDRKLGVVRHAYCSADEEGEAHNTRSFGAWRSKRKYETRYLFCFHPSLQQLRARPSAGTT